MNSILKKIGMILNEGSECESACEKKELGEGFEEDQIVELLDEIEEQLLNIIDNAESLSRITHGHFKGQLDSYFIPWMIKFHENEDQPGSIASLRQLSND